MGRSRIMTLTGIVVCVGAGRAAQMRCMLAVAAFLSAVSCGLRACRFARFRTLLAVSAAFSLATYPVGAFAKQDFSTCEPGQPTQFVFGFAMLQAQLGDVMGQPTSCEYADQTELATHSRTRHQDLRSGVSRRTRPRLRMATRIGRSLLLALFHGLGRVSIRLEALPHRPLA